MTTYTGFFDLGSRVWIDLTICRPKVRWRTVVPDTALQRTEYQPTWRAFAGR